MKPQLIAVIGAGVMGSDIALDLSCYNYSVILKDIQQEALEKAADRIKKNFKLVKLMKKTLSPVSLEKILSRIQFTTDYTNFLEVDLVIENITEVYEAKRFLYEELREVCGEDVVYGVNTSCISITKLGGLLPRPENVIGLHFLNPVPLKELVEVIKGHHTSENTVNKIKRFLKTLNKTCVVVNDSPGFVTNRVLMLNESIWLVQDDVSQPKDIDKIFTLGFGHKMGPLATADLIGLDTVLNSLLVLYDSYSDPKFRPCPLLKEMVDGGRLGKKTGKGFFEYLL
jgi:3-hydroxybutyryl-CoA dehydrogenase